jgi:hypothetical protein
MPRMTILSPAGMTPRELSDEVIGVRDAPFLCCQATSKQKIGPAVWRRRNKAAALLKSHKFPVPPRTRGAKVVMRGLDPRIHLLRKKAHGEEDGLPGQARQ